MRLSLGSTGCQPVVFGSLPKNFFRHHFTKGVALFAGKVPATAGWRHDLMTWVTVQSNDIGDTFWGIYALERSFGVGGADAIGPRLQGKKGIVQLVVSPFWGQSQERLQVAEAVSCWGYRR